MDPSVPLTHHSSSWPLLKPRWAINLEGKVIEIPKIVIAKVKANPTHVIGWFNNKLRKAWRLIFPLTEESTRMGHLPFTDSISTYSPSCFLFSTPAYPNSYSSR